MDNRERFLNKPLTPEQLDAKFDDGYWHYLAAPEFQETFFVPMAIMIKQLEVANVLDVGCGLGSLKDCLNPQVRYIGVDGSEKLIDHNRANNLNENAKFVRADIAVPSRFSALRPVECIVFGGVLEVLIQQDQRLAFINMYRSYFSPRYVVVYDLVRLNTDEFTPANGLKLVDSFVGRANVDGIQEVKKERKVLFYECV